MQAKVAPDKSLFYQGCPAEGLRLQAPSQAGEVQCLALRGLTALLHDHMHMRTDTHLDGLSLCPLKAHPVEKSDKAGCTRMGVCGGQSCASDDPTPTICG